MTGTGGAGGASCASNASCGGDIVGMWAIAKACNIKTSFPTACADETYSVSNEDQTGTIVFRADGTATQMIRTTGTLTDSLPWTCLMSSGQTCADVDTNFKSMVLTGSDYTAATCSDLGSTCVCLLMFDLRSSTSGTYTTSGSTATLTSNGNDTVVSYCVAGSTLVLSPASTTGDPAAVYVLTRQ